MPVRLGSPLPNIREPGGVCKRQSGLSFKQSPKWLCGFEPRHPCQTFTLAVAQTAERCTVNAERCGFESRRPTSLLTRGVSQAGLRRATLYRVSAGSNPARPAKLYETVAERLRHWIVDPDYASSNLVRFAFLHCAASSTGTSTRLLSGGLRVRVPRGAYAFGV